MQQCTRCGRDVRVGSSFCPHCGEPSRDDVDGRPSPFSREAPPAPPGPPAPPPPPTDDFRFAGPPPAPAPGSAPPPPYAPVAPTRTAAEALSAVSSGALGIAIAIAIAVLQVLPGFVTAANDDDFSKGGFALLSLPVLAVVAVATWTLRHRTRGRSPSTVEALSLGLGAFTTAYGLLLLLTVALSSEGQAVQLVL